MPNGPSRAMGLERGMRLSSLLAHLRPRSGTPARATELREAASRSHVGRVRTVNQDRVLVRSDRGLWAVADGMGGHSGGGQAADTAIEALDSLARSTAPIDQALICEALARANTDIYADARDHGRTSGTTVVVAAWNGADLTVCWAGDSRAYLVRDRQAQQLTHDHSVVGELIEAGLLTEQMAAGHPQANVVTRALGASPMVAIDSVSTTLRDGDLLLLCSDGLSRSLDPRDFTHLPDGLEDIAERLVTKALQRDGGDNTSLIVVR
jgi:serine/threonine protein phosphatase PrpC